MTYATCFSCGQPGVKEPFPWCCSDECFSTLTPAKRKAWEAVKRRNAKKHARHGFPQTGLSNKQRIFGAAGR